MTRIQVDISARLVGHRGAIYALEISSTGKIYSGGGDGLLVCWLPEDYETGVLVAKIPEPIYAIKLSADEQSIWAGTMNGGLYNIKLDGSGLYRGVSHHRKGIFDIVDLDDVVITAGGDGKVSLWDSARHVVVQSCQLSHKAIRSLCFLDSERLAAGASDGKIYTLKSDCSFVLNSLVAHEPSVFCLKRDQETLFTAGRDAQIRTWSLFNLKNEKTIAAHNVTVNDLALHRSLPWLLSASRDKTIRLWNRETMQLLHVFDQSKYLMHTNSVNAVSWLDDQHFVSCGDDGLILIWKIDSLNT